MSLKLYRRGPKGQGLEVSPVASTDWRSQLRSQRWHTPALRNTEARLISPFSATLLGLALAALTFVLLVGGYGIGFWHA